ncbi:InlB B-repeat-containing protein [Cohnella caldifontis]|uniref:InlB B-repeat-containing protein n=1 Tax=Cohnella caldifontis TaxID=3027471 RepID=UPI0023EBAE8E|nr:InlB B-repeat-containing protein [Cohnella sp. YIM B05605]
MAFKDAPYVYDVNVTNKLSVMKYTGTWEYVGQQGLTPGFVHDSSLIISDGIPYVIYSDEANENKATVMKFNGTDWVPVGSPGFSSGLALNPSLFVEAGTFYAAYQDGSASSKSTVMKFDGTDWVTLGGGTSVGAWMPSLYVEDGTPYLAYININSFKVTVDKYDGSEWVSVGDPEFSPSTSREPLLYVKNGVPLVAFLDYEDLDYQMSVMKYDFPPPVAPVPPTIVLNLDPAGPTKDNVTIGVTATADGEDNSIAVLRWADGDQSIDYFQNGGGEDIDGNGFTVDSNGTYTVYAKDTEWGYEQVQTITVGNIYRSTPLLIVEYTPQGYVLLDQGFVFFDVFTGIGSTSVNKVETVLWDMGELTAEDFRSGVYGNPLDDADSLTVDRNGTYTFYVRDTAGNENVKSVVIDKFVPAIYTVSFNGNGGSNTGNQKVGQGFTVIQPYSPTKSGFTFGGWYSDEELTMPYDFSTPVSNDLILYAKWNAPSEVTHTVTFESNGGTAVDTRTVVDGVTVTEPDAPTKSGYTFGGWYSDEALTVPYDFSTPVTGDLELYAKWDEIPAVTHTVTFDSNGGTTVSSKTVVDSNTVTQPDAPTKSGFTFAGWYADEALTVSYDFSTPVTGNLTLYAKWDEVPVVTHTVTFDSNGGTTVNSKTVVDGNTVTQPDAPTKSGFTFAGWYSDEALTVPYDFSTPVTGDLTLYAKWDEIPAVTHTVTFAVYGGSAVESQLVIDGGMVIEPAHPTKNGFTFAGWYADEALTVSYDFSTPVTGDLALYAKWNPITVVNHTVAFNSNGGSAVDRQTVADGSKAAPPANPTRDGYAFAGWYSDSALKSAFDFQTPINRNVTLYAKWTAITSGSGDGGGAGGGSGSVGGGNSQPDRETVTADVQSGGTVSTLEITRADDGKGGKKDEVVFSPDAVAKAIRQASGVMKVTVPDAKDEVSETYVSIPKASATLLSERKASLEIATNNVRIQVPSESLLGSTDDLYFRVVPAKSENEQTAVERRIGEEPAFVAVTAGSAATVIGRPMTIESNLHNGTATLVMPIEDETLTDEQLQDLGVFIEHSDGEKEWVKGEIVPYDDSGNLAIRFTVSKFSTFTIVHADGLGQKLAVNDASGDPQHKAYISGNPGGVFEPSRNMTRAELAAILAHVADRPAKAVETAYKDVPPAYWAKDAIDSVTKMGLMSGYPDGSFKPNAPVTRAEMANIVARLLGVRTASSTDASFPDVTGNWAQKAIAQVHAAGLVSGYEDGTFRPERTLTRAEAVTLINKWLGREPRTDEAPMWTDVPATHWAFGAIQEASLDR